MRLAIRANDDAQSRQVKKKLLTLFEEYSLEYDEANPDVVISVGGDGTLLSAFHHYRDTLSTIKFLAIHTGNLGFYTDFLKSELSELMRALTSSMEQTNSYPLLDVTLLGEEGSIEHYYALNEMTLKNMSGTLVCDVFIGEQLLEIYRGDGLCVATPTGSTGLSKSLGGAVVHPKLDAMQLVEIAPLNNRVYRTIGSPLLFPKKEILTLSIQRANIPYVTIDNLDPILLDTTKYKGIQVSIAAQRVMFANYKNIDFWTRVEKSFIGTLEGNDGSINETDGGVNEI